MKKRDALLLWPLPLAPVLALVTIKVSGPTYTTAVEQGAIVTRFFAMVFWTLGCLVGMGITLLLMPKVKTDELITGLLSALFSAGIFYVMVNSVG